MGNPSDFKKEDRITRLLWCNRHCCLCGKTCDIDIEVAHLPGRENSDNIEDGIPVCSYCHIKMNAYNPNHPKGTSYKVEELIKRRDQIYEEYTRHLVPPIDFQIAQNLANGRKCTFPKVLFNIRHRGDSLSVEVLVKAGIYKNGKFLRYADEGHYAGKESWNLNPHMAYLNGNFEIPEAVGNTDRFEIKVFITIIDKYKRYHELLPVSWVYERNGDYWFANP